MLKVRHSKLEVEVQGGRIQVYGSGFREDYSVSAGC